MENEQRIEQLNPLDIILKSFGQIMLQENRWTGLLFLVGLFLGSWQYGVASLLAVVVGNATAMVFKFDQDEIRAGIYGFSAALVGVVLPFLFEMTGLIWLLVVVGGSFAAILQHFFIQKKIPAYTFPFILVSWLLIFGIQQYTSTAASSLVQWGVDFKGYEILLLGTKAYGQVIFQGGIWGGILFFIAVFIHSKVGAVYALLSAYLGALLGMLFGFPQQAVEMGIFGFNPVLTAIVFAGPKLKNAVWILIGVVLTFLVQMILLETNVLSLFGGVLTFPFVAGTWLTLILKKCIQK